MFPVYTCKKRDDDVDIRLCSLCVLETVSVRRHYYFTARTHAYTSLRRGKHHITLIVDDANTMSFLKRLLYDM